MADARCLARILKRMESIKQFVSKPWDGNVLSDIQINLQLLKEEWSEYRIVEQNIRKTEENEQLQNQIESNYFSIKRDLLRAEHENLLSSKPADSTIQDLLLNQQSFLEEVSNLNKSIATPRDDIRLPRVNVPYFSGIYSEFNSFRDLFEASVGNNNNISKAQKLQYLKGLLRGEAPDLIRHIPITTANYEEAWDIIKSRYDRKGKVIMSLIAKFIDQPSISKINSKALLQIRNISDEAIRGLRVLGHEAEGRDPWLIYILTSKLDTQTRQAWNLDTVDIQFPNFERFIEFLSKYGEALEDTDIHSNKTNFQNRPLISKPVHSLHTLASTSNISCPKCESEHYLNQCKEFMNLNVLDRKGFVAENRLCFNCLSHNYLSITCRSRYRCRKCNLKHHTLLHQDVSGAAVVNINPNLEIEEQNNLVQSTDDVADVNTAILKAVCTPESNQIQGNTFQSLLPTVIVNIRDSFGNLQECRALLDSGAQASFISESCVQRLRLPRKNAKVTIKGITSGSLVSKGMVSIVAFSKYSEHDFIDIDALILQLLPSTIPSHKTNINNLFEIRGLQLADPHFNNPKAIDLILGADKFFSILKDGKISYKSCIAQNTMFGWVVAGNNSIGLEENVEQSAQILTLQLDLNIDLTLRKFWETEELITPKFNNPENEECEKLYEISTKRNHDGRFIVRIPFKQNSAILGNSVTVAEKRFYAMERKFSADEKLKREYTAVINEYIKLNHMVKIPYEKLHHDEKTSFYLPHHAVIKQSSSTTKLRVVFDGSSKSSSGISLNDKMLVGPTLQPSLWSNLIRFRRNEIVIAADIEKMYRQVMVDEEDTDYQRIVWRENKHLPLQHYKLTTVTFGLASSAYLAIKSMQKTSFDFEKQYPEASKVIRSDFYVDDFLSGASNIDDAISLKREVSLILKSGGFSLRKWISNVPALNESYLTIQSQNNSLSFDDHDQSTKILGLQWNPNTDTFSFTVNLPFEDVSTKRSMISHASRIFDPLGLLAPSIISIKILFQKLWLVKLDWDQPLPDNVASDWVNIKNQLKELEQLKIPRYISHDNIELHGFSDASEMAYAAVVYCKYVDKNNVVQIQIIASKTKVAPIKTISLPRLELCAAHLLSKLLKDIQNSVGVINKIFAWTDSSIVLAWLSDHPSRWKTFVSNRVAEILEILPRRNWSHVKSKDNPADYASRGILPSKLLNLNIWWQGPTWLKENENTWPISNDNNATENEITRERRKEKATILISQTNSEGNIICSLIDKFSSYNKLRRVLCYIYRFYNNSKSDSKRYSESYLTVEELDNATEKIVKQVQQIDFQRDISELNKNKRVNNKSKIISLSPFLDMKGILRVGGRLENSMCEYNAKHPIILSKENKLSTLLIKYIHEKYLHPGPSLTTSLLRQKYWIIHGRSVIRSEIKKCITCFKQKCKGSEQLMGELPSARVVPARPFSQCGVDFAGPVFILSKRGRGGKTTKGYIAVFVCMVTKAVHIEIVMDLTSDAFIAALKRFVARRGLPSDIHSDNGTNFQGANRKFNEIYHFLKHSNNNSFIADFLADVGIRWHFIPPGSPHFGGLWEAAVKSVKSNLAKATGNINLTHEELSTLLCQIEAILNSRPLCPISEDVCSIEALTPAHFLVGTELTSIPEVNFENMKESRLSRFEVVQQRAQLFWKRFSREYLHNLQQRYKWQNKCVNLDVNDMVLIKEENLPTCKWILGRIISVSQDKNNLVRVATIRTARGVLKRNITKLCKLPV